MEITAMTFVSLSIIGVCIYYSVYVLLKNFGDKEDVHSTLNRPLKNKNKYWFNP